MNNKGNIALIPLIIALIVVVVLFVSHKITLPGTTHPPAVSLKTQYQNPFDSSSQYVNPFSSYKNPFDNLK